MGPADCRHTNVTMVDGRPIVDGMAKQCNACGFLVHETFDEREQAIRADERARVAAEVVAYLYEQATHWRDEDGESALMHAREVIAAGEHRPKPGQPKEGE